MTEPLDDLRQELLELHFGCHPDPAELEARIAASPELQAMRAEVAAEAEILIEAAREPLPELELSTARPWWSRGARRFGAVAAAAVLFLLLPTAAWWGYESVRLAALDRQTQLVITAPQGVADGAPLQFTVQARRLGDGSPLSTDFRWSVRSEAGEVLAEGASFVDGQTTLTVPASLDGVRQIAVTGAESDETVTLALHPSRRSPVVHLTSDKPIYRPGETARFRAVQLERLNLTPNDDPGMLQVVDAQGNVVRNAYPERENGVTGLLFDVPDGAAGGPWELRAHDRTGRQVARLGFEVRRFQPSKLAKRVTLDRPSYGAGDDGVATISAQRIGGGPAAEAEVEAEVLIDGRAVWSEITQLDTKGEARLLFRLPETVESSGDARFVAKVRDGGLIETSVESFVIPGRSLEISTFPEGGSLVVGLESRLYFETRDALGRPLASRGRIVDSEGRAVARFATEARGRGRVSFVPSPDMAYRFVVDAPQPQEITLGAADADGVVLRALAERFEPDRPLRLRVGAARAEELVVAAFCRGVLVGQTRVPAGAARDVELEVDPRASGVLRVTAFGLDMQPRAERLVQRRTGRGLRVAVAARDASVRPGQEQVLTVRTQDHAGNPVAATVGLVVADAAVHADAIHPRVGLLDHFELFADVAELEEKGDYLGAAPATSVDLLLGTRGWRRFDWLDPTAIAPPDEAASTFVASGAAGFDDQVQSRQSGEEHASKRYNVWWDQREAMRWLTLALLVSGFLMLVWLGVESGMKLASRAFGSAPWIGGVVGGVISAAAIFGILFLIMIAMGGLGAAMAPEMAAADSVRLGERAGGIKEVEEGFSFWSEEPSLEASVSESRVQHERREERRSGQWQRTFAHDARPSRVRQDFTEVIYWNPLLRTNANGEAEVRFETSDRVTTWRIDADVHAATTGGGAIGQSRDSFVAVQPLELAVKLPVEVTAGDRIELPVAIISRNQGDAVDLDTRAQGAVRTVDPPSRVDLKNGRGRAVVALQVGEGTGARFGIAGRVGRDVDAVEHDLRVVPRGFPHRRSTGGAVATSHEFVVEVPQTDSMTAVLEAYPSPLAALRDGLEGLLQEPHGCFEQASSTNYPNVMTLTYLQATGDVVPSLATRAADLLRQGYGKLASYECSERGYEWFGANPGHEALTAYGLLQFTDMAKVYDVEDSMVARTRGWLLNRRDGDGGFALGEGALSSFSRAPRPTTNAYSTYALLYAGEPATAMAREVQSIADRATVTDDGYELALCALGLQLAGRSAEAERARQRLASMQDPAGFVDGVATITRSGERDRKVETTSFAILAWLDGADYASNCALAARFLETMRDASGRFGATQATIGALRALTAMATDDGLVAGGSGTLRIRVDDRLVAERPFSAQQIEPVRVDLRDSLVRGVNTIVLEVADGGPPLPFAFDLAYRSDQPANDPGAAVQISTQMSADRVTEGDVVQITAVIHNVSGQPQPMANAIVGLPASLEASPELLDRLRESGAIDFWEISGREVALYWRSLDRDIRHEIKLDCIARIPGQTTGPASRAYLYYTPDSVHWAEPLSVEVVARD